MKSKLIMVIDWLILITLMLIVMFMMMNDYHLLQQIVVGLLLIIWCGYLVKKYYKKRPSIKSKIKTIQLLNEREVVVKEWYIRDEQGLLIGKNFQNQLVDIDLTDSDYAVLIDKQHAALNQVNGKWFLEDLGSRNGTGVKGLQASRIKRLKEEEVVSVHPGDRIYIAKTILQLVG